MRRGEWGARSRVGRRGEERREWAQGEESGVQGEERMER
jgi:hypothetical protein